MSVLPYTKMKAVLHGSQNFTFGPDGISYFILQHFPDLTL